jgi:hypothetical protein
MFSPILFSIGVVTTSDSDADLVKLKEALAKSTTDSNSGFIIDSEAVAFANIHPDPSKGILVEVQALTEESREKGIELVTNLVTETLGVVFVWDDVTEAALAYHTELRANEASRV